MLRCIQYRQFECYGNAKRMGTERLAKKVLGYFPPGIRGRGRPQHSLMNDIEAKEMVEGLMGKGI